MLKLAELLREKGATVGILTLQVDPDRYGSEHSGAEILTVRGPMTSSLCYWAIFPFWQRKLSRKISEWCPDVLVPQVFPANWWAWLHNKKNRKIPIVWVCQEPSAFIHSRNWIDALQPVWKKYLARIFNPVLARIDIRLSLFSDKIVANSHYTSGMVERIYHRKADAIAYPAIDFCQFSPDSKVKKEDLIITVAKLSRFKRVDFLLQVFSQVQKQHPGLIYHIVGRGEEEENLHKLARKLNISRYVRFHGRLDNKQLADLHRRAKLFLHGSVEEPFGMAPLEAIACNTPVIAHRSGGPLEFVNETCGRLVDSLSAEKWSEEIAGFLLILETNPEYFTGVAENAQRFSWESTLSPLLQLTAEAASGHCGQQ
jgi:glycosyltransferase involved in cell wall biosynthesis